MKKFVTYLIILCMALPSYAQVVRPPSPGGGGGGGYTSILDEGTPLTARTKLNFIGSAVNCVDNGGSTRTDCTITAGSGSSVGAANALQMSDGSSAFLSANAATFATSLTGPLLIGGTGVGSDLTLQSTSGVGNGTDTILFKAGNNGATTLATLSTAGSSALTPFTFLASDGTTQAKIESTTSATDYPDFTAGLSGVGASYGVGTTSGNANVPVNFAGKGSGAVNIGNGSFATPILSFSGDPASLLTYPVFYRTLNAASAVSVGFALPSSGSFALRPASGGNYNEAANQAGAVDLQLCAPSASTSIASGVNSLAAGCNSTASGTATVSLGSGNVASSANSVAIGLNNTAQTSGAAVAIGSTNIASGANASAIGVSNTASATSSSAIGTTNTASGTSSFAGGSSNISSNTATVALGASNTASQTNAVAIGLNNTSSSASTVTIGEQSNASNDRAVVLGYQGGSQGNDRSFTYSGGQIAGLYDAMWQVHMMKATIASASTTATRLTTNGSAAGSNNTLNFNGNDQSAFISCNVNAFNLTAAAQAMLSYQIRGILTRGTGVATTAWTSTSGVVATETSGTVGTPTLTAAADTTNGGLDLTFTASATPTGGWHVLAKCDAVRVK